MDIKDKDLETMLRTISNKKLDISPEELQSRFEKVDVSKRGLILHTENKELLFEELDAEELRGILIALFDFLETNIDPELNDRALMIAYRALKERAEYDNYLYRVSSVQNWLNRQKKNDKTPPDAQKASVIDLNKKDDIIMPKNLIVDTEDNNASTQRNEESAAERAARAKADYFAGLRMS